MLTAPSSSGHENGFKILQEQAAPAAFHNSKPRVDPPRCHPRTRVAVLEELFDRVVGNMPRETWIAWLNGAAGAGKSAICQSFSEICIQRDIKVATFFFSRTDATRNTVDPVVATLVYQTIKLCPDTKEFILHSIESDPLIFEQSVSTQIDVLIAPPIRHLHASNPNLTLLLIIDGLDECTDITVQMDLIRPFSELLQHRDLSLAVLFSSRRETHNQVVFDARNTDNILRQIPLDDNYQAKDDIRRFLVDGFNDIECTHPLRKPIAAKWPTPG